MDAANPSQRLCAEVFGFKSNATSQGCTQEKSEKKLYENMAVMYSNLNRGDQSNEATLLYPCVTVRG